MSLAEQVLAAREAKQAAHTVTLEIPGWSGTLWATYRPLSWRQARQIGLRHEALKSQVEKELRAAADGLAAACTGCEARVKGKVEPLPPLGLALCAALGLDGAENDGEAVLMVFPSEDDVIDQSNAVQRAEGLANGLIDEELAGNSEAVAR